MQLAHLKILTLMCGFCSRLQTISNLKVQRGSDVTLRCDVPLFSESSTLLWIKDTGQTSNTTLVYNNSAYIILHNVDDHSEGIYYCKWIENGSVDTVINHTLIVTPYAEGKKHTIYRQSSSHSDLLLIFKSKKKYQRLMWIWESKRHSTTELIAVEKGGEVQVKGPIKLGQKTSTTYNGQFFILHISPVKFNYDGTYRCIPNDNDSPYTTTTLHTIRVSAEPSGGVLRNQSVVLTCEVSDVSDSVTLVWLRMEGNVMVLVKEQILNETNNKILLTVNVSSLQSDLLDWQCAVFTENTLRAVASVSSSSSTTDAAVFSIAGKITVVIVVTLFAGVLLGVLVYYWYRKQMPGTKIVLLIHHLHIVPTSFEHKHNLFLCFFLSFFRSASEESEPVYMNISKTMNDRAQSYNTVGNRNPRPEVHRQLRQMNIVRRDETPVTSESVTYASIYFNSSRLKTSPHLNKRTG
ncbi:uncharacterized protein LOC130555244 isoform X2 [Triplophysa rosa]|uniref:uncharacterized protein LOC130555244 isoform X2 n=1 Tax=Triplophysa rosa TaxID=992332 RepID=UPI0025461547|nr:uncharacterized protein LOC130555244 isoform X2 [Triplophysa rosa]